MTGYPFQNLTTRLLVLFTLCGGIASHAQEFILRDDSKAIDYGPYLFRTNTSMMLNHQFSIVMTTNRTFYIKGFVLGIGHRSPAVAISNNATVKIGDDSLRIIAEESLARHKEFQRQAAIEAQKKRDDQLAKANKQREEELLRATQHVAEQVVSSEVTAKHYAWISGLLVHESSSIASRSAEKLKMRNGNGC